MSEKRCTKCGEVKGLEEFTRREDAKDGRRNDCKACVSARDKQRYIEKKEDLQAQRRNYYLENRASIQAAHNAYNIANATKIKDWKKAYRAANRERLAVEERAYREANPEKVKAYHHAYYIANRERIKARNTAYVEANKDMAKTRWAAWRRKNTDRMRERSRLSFHRRRARMLDNGGRGITATDLLLMREQQESLCAYCKRDMRDPEVRESLDHVIPIDQGGPHDPDNAVLCCPVCNSSKNNRTPEQWVNRWYERK